MRGSFITFEGVDGSGKSTLVRAVADRLRSEGSDVVETFEPGDSPLGATLRAAALTAENDPLTELLLFTADRAAHMRTVVRPALIAGSIVLCDRYEGSTTAYQGVWRGLGADRVKEVSQQATYGLTPHLTVWVDIPKDVAAARRSRPEDGMDRATYDSWDELDASYRKQAQDGGWLRIDGAAPLEVQVEQVADAVRRLTEARRDSRRLVIICGPSGSGKSTLVEQLTCRPDTRYVLSATTRPARPSETDGEDYLFVDETRFQQMEAEGLLAETSRYAGHSYGTVSASLQDDGRHRICVVETEGMLNILRQHPEAVTVFITVPEETLAGRLQARATEDSGDRDDRLARARRELRIGPGLCDVTVDGEDLAGMTDRLTAILGPERSEV